MREAAALAQLLDAAARGIQAGKGRSEAPIAELLGWLKPFLPALGHPEAPKAVQKHLGKKAAALREQQQREVLQQEQQHLPEQRQRLEKLLQAYATASPACIELLQLLDASISRLLQAAVEGSRAAQRGLPEGTSPAAARAKQLQQKQQERLTESDEVEETARAAQAAALLACAALRNVTLESLPSTAATRQRLAAAIAAPLRLLSIGEVMLPLPSASGETQQQHAVLQLCLCRLLSAVALCTPAAAWRVASAAQGATAAAAAAASAHGALSGGGEREAQQHPLNPALSALCEGPARRLLLHGRRSGKRNEASDSDPLLPPPPAQGRICCCHHCSNGAPAAPAAAAKDSGGAGGSAVRKCWHRAWGPFFVRCCCLACCRGTDPTSSGSACGVRQQPKDVSAAADTERKTEAAAAAASAASDAATRVRAAVEVLRSREAVEGLAGCGLVPIRYALRQEALRLLLVLLLHRDPLVNEALLQPRWRQHQPQQVRASRGGPAESGSTNRLRDGVALLRCAFRGLRTDRELDGLYFLVGLYEMFEWAKGGGRLREAEATARRLFLAGGSGGFEVPALLQAFTSREDLHHLMQPLCRSADEANAACGPARDTGEASGFFSGSWMLQRLLSYFLLLAAARGFLRGGALIGAAEEQEAAMEVKGTSFSASPLLSLALSVRPLHMPPQQELLLLIFKAQPALVPHFLRNVSGLLLTPRRSCTFALSCLFLCRLMESPWICGSRQQQEQHLLPPAQGTTESTSLFVDIVRLHLMAAAVCEGRAEASSSAKLPEEAQQGLPEDEETTPFFGDLESLRLRHAQQQQKQQEQLQRRRRVVDLAVASVAPPALFIRQHVTQCLLQADIRLVFCGLAVLRTCCQALRCMHESLKDDPELQRLLLAQAAMRLPDAKTLVNALLRLIQQWQQQQYQRHKEQPATSKRTDGPESSLTAAAYQERFWPSDEALARVAAATAAAAAKERQQQEAAQMRIEREGDAGGSDGDDEVEVHVDGLGEAEEGDATSSGEETAEETADPSSTAVISLNEVPVQDLLQLLVHATSLRSRLGSWRGRSADSSSSLEGVSDPCSVSLPLLLGWLEAAEVYQGLLTPSFPLDWGKLLCTWRPDDAESQAFWLCCRWRRVATGITRLGVQARGGVAAWGTEIAQGGTLTKQQQVLLLHMLLQWRHDVERSERDIESPRRKRHGMGETEPTDSCSGGSLQSLLQFMHASGLFSRSIDAGGFDEAAVWLASLAQSSCFRCSTIYFVAILRLATERRLALLPFAAGCASAGQENAQDEGPGEAGLSLFTVALLSHLAVTPRCNEGKALYVELPPLGVSAPVNSCWGCDAMHAPQFCAEAVTRWAVQGFMRCCILRPGGELPFLDWLQAEGPWRVLGAALYVGREELQGNGARPHKGDGMEAARAAAAQHPESKAINKCRKRLVRFLEQSCSPSPAEAKTQGGDGWTELTLEEQLARLSLVSSHVAADCGESFAVHEVSPQALLRVAAARLPGGASPSQGLVALSERTNCLGLLGSLTRHLQQIMEYEDLVGALSPEALSAADKPMYDRLAGVVLQLEAASWQVKTNTSASSFSAVAGSYASNTSAAAMTLATAEPVKRLIGLATMALESHEVVGSLGHDTNGVAPPARQSKRKEGGRRVTPNTEGAQFWVEMGAALCSHVANLCESSSLALPHSVTCGPAPQQSAALGLRLLRRVVAFFAALARTEAMLTPEARSAFDLAKCMQRLRLSADANLTATDAEATGKGPKPHQRETGPLKELLLCLLRRVARATQHLVSEDGQCLLLLACESVVTGSDKAGNSSLANLRWLLPLIECWGLAGFQINSERRQQQGGLTPAEGKVALTLLLEACGNLSLQNGIFADTVALVRRLQTLDLADAVQLHCVLDRLREQQRASERACRLPVAGDQGTEGASVRDETPNADLEAAARVLLCLSFECASAANPTSGASGPEGDGAAGKDLVVVFRPALVRSLRACWDRSRSLRHICTRLFLQQKDGKAGDCVLLHPAVRLALLLQWRGPIQDLPASLYPSLLAALQHCQHGMGSQKGAGAADGNAARKRRKGAHSQHQADGAQGSRMWASEVLEALKLSVYARDASGPSGKRIRSKAAPWQIAATFFESDWVRNESSCLATEAPRRWAEATQQFLYQLCVQQPGGEGSAYLGMHLARDLEEVAGSVDEPFTVTEGWPVDGWARYHAASLVLQAAKSSGSVAAAAVRSLAAGRAGIGAVLKDLKTELGELQEALQGLDLAGEGRYSPGEDGAAAAAADLAYFLGVTGRASQLGQVVLDAVRRGTPANAGLSKDERQFFKALRPRAQSVACGFLEALAPSPPTAAIHCGAEALVRVPIGGDGTLGSSPVAQTADILSVQAWVGLLVPAMQLAMAAATLEPSVELAKSSAKRIARQGLLSPALAALGQSAKAAVTRALSVAGDGADAAADLAVALMPLLQCLCEQVLPAANENAEQEGAELPQDYDVAGDEQADNQPSFRLSEACPELFEALTSLCGASTSCADGYLCRMLMLDSSISCSRSHGTAAEAAQGSQRSQGSDPHVEASEELQSSNDVFTTDFMWMAQLPDFREVAQANAADESGRSTNLPLRLRLGGPCEWLALDPRRVKDTLDNFAFHAKAYETMTAAAQQHQILAELASRQQRLLEFALKARYSLAGDEGFEEVTQGAEAGQQAAFWKERLLTSLADLQSAVEIGATHATVAATSAYNVAYVVPYLAGRLSTACFVLLWRWQRLLEEEQLHQQQARQQRDEEGANGGSLWTSSARSRPVCEAERARRACGVAGAWLRSLEEATENANGDTDAAAAKEEAQADARDASSGDTAAGASSAAAADASSAAAVDAVPCKRRREDVWEMDEFSPEEVQPAVARVSAFLKAARRIGRFWRPLSSDQDAKTGNQTPDKELGRRLEAWGAAVDDGDQWLSSFANGGGLQLLIMALGCPDQQTRQAAAHGLAIYTHLLQLSADRSLLCHFADVHDFNMQRRKRSMNNGARNSRRRDLQQRHKAATLAFKEVRQLLTLLTSLMTSVKPLQRKDAEKSGSSSQEAGAIQALSPVVCSFAAAVVPFLSLPDHPLYPLLNYALLKHPAISLLLHESCMPLTLAASRQPLLGSEGVFSRLLLSPSAATSTVQKKFVLLVLRRAMAASHCLDDGAISLSARLQAHMTSQAILPPPAILALSELPLLSLPTYNSTLARGILECLLISAAAPHCLSDCSWWAEHAAFRLVSFQAVASDLSAGESPEETQSNFPVRLPLATVNAQHLLQRFGILQWIDNQLQAVLATLVPTVGHTSTEHSAASKYASLLGRPLPPPPLTAAVRGIPASQYNTKCSRSVPLTISTSEMPEASDALKWLPVVRDCTRLLWSLIAAATLAAPLPDVIGTEHFPCGDSTGCCAAQATALEAQGQRCAMNILRTKCHDFNRITEAQQAPQANDDAEPSDVERNATLWPLSTASEAHTLRSAIIGARRQLFHLRRPSEDDAEEAGARSGRAAVKGNTMKGASSSALGLYTQAARQLHLDLFQGIQRLARAWFAFGVAAGVFVRTSDSFSLADATCMHNSPALVADLQQASMACLAGLWAVASCSQSVGLFTRPAGSAECAGVFQQQQQLQASGCRADVLRLCSWAAALRAHSWNRNWPSEKLRYPLSAYVPSSLWDAVFVALCEKGFGRNSRVPYISVEVVSQRSPCVLLALLQIRDVCGADDLLQELIAVAEGV